MNIFTFIFNAIIGWFELLNYVKLFGNFSALDFICCLFISFIFISFIRKSGGK